MHKNDIHTKSDRTAEIIGQVLIWLAIALFLCGYAVMQIIQKILCSILQVILFFAAVALGG